MEHPLNRNSVVPSFSTIWKEGQEGSLAGLNVGNEREISQLSLNSLVYAVKRTENREIVVWESKTIPATSSYINRAEFLQLCILFSPFVCSIYQGRRARTQNIILPNLFAESACKGSVLLSFKTCFFLVANCTKSPESYFAAFDLLLERCLMIKLNILFQKIAANPTLVLLRFQNFLFDIWWAILSFGFEQCKKNLLG